FGGRYSGGNEFLDRVQREAEHLQFRVALRRVFALQFVDDLVKLVFLLHSALRAPHSALKEFVPRVAAAEANHKIVGRQLQSAERIDEQGDQFRVGRRIGLAKD